MPILPSLAQWRAAGRTFSFGGREVFLRVDGDGPALLLIHGFPSAGWDWCKLWPALRARFTLVAPDLLGFGFSAKPAGHRYAIAEQADLCLAALREAGATAAHVLAHDYGDTVAQELLARTNEERCPVRLRSFVFLNGGLFPETHRPLLVQRLLASPLGPYVAKLTTRATFEASMRRIAGRAQPPSPQELDAFWTLLTREAGLQALPRLIHYMAERRQQRARWVGALQQAHAPIRLVDGVDDPVSGAHMVARFRELVPHAPVHELAGVGHYPQLEAPAAVLAALRAHFEPFGLRPE